MRRFLLLLACTASTSALAQRPQAELSCRFTGTDFVYDCVIQLTRAGQPLDGVQISLGADMPSMPMAHNVAPVKAKPGAKPGEYQARLDLEMTGEWAVKLRLSGPVRDQIVVHYEFDDSGARPARPRSRESGTPPRK
ncbi:MAG: FixH family protein [Betaproteobacteria bacterium]|nr:FixH family protein [Betaproteobacteria bacterium]